MNIECKTFNQWLKVANKGAGISPGGMAKQFNVTRQTINNWINNDIIDAYRYEGKEGRYTIIMMSEYEKVREFKRS